MKDHIKMNEVFGNITCELVPQQLLKIRNKYESSAIVK